MPQSITPDRETDPEGRRIELYVRSLAARTGESPQERAIEELRRLEATGTIDAFSIRIWGERVGLSTTAVETDCGQDVLERIGEFREWANRTGVTLSPFFESHRTTSRVTGEEYLTLELPVVAMAEYDGDSLEYVTPHADRHVTRSVADRLERFGDEREQPARVPRSSPAGE